VALLVLHNLWRIILARACNHNEAGKTEHFGNIYHAGDVRAIGLGQKNA
jgi:hypothetical protein